MNISWAGKRYWTTRVQDNADGYVGVRLHEDTKGAEVAVAEVVYWDASGQFYVKTLNHEVPLQILESLVAEAKELLDER
jgi:hypothetical protein